MDQCACAYSGITAMSFQEERPAVHRIDVDPDELGYVLYVVQTGGDHRDLTEDYAQITREMGKVAEFFGAERKVMKKSLRESPLNFPWSICL